MGECYTACIDGEFMHEETFTENGFALYET